jgi:hypothetical protein
MKEEELKKLKEAEDYVNLFLSGGHCTKSTHEPARQLHKLIAWKLLTLEFPHLSRNLAEIEREIVKELKRG